MPRCDLRFWGGMLFGILITLLYTEKRLSSYMQIANEVRTQNSATEYQLKKELDLILPEEQEEYGDSHQINFSGNNQDEKVHDLNHGLQHVHEASNITSVLFDRVRVLCWIMSYPTEKNKKKVIAVRDTWTRRCNKVIYFSTFENLNVVTVDLNFTNGRNFLWDKTKKVLTYLQKTYGNEYDWFFKADDDTFAVMENLRFLLSQYDPGQPLYLGCNFKLNKVFYNSGGAGYVLSRKALEVFVTRGLGSKGCPSGTGGPEDYNLGRCMSAIAVNVTDTRDYEGKLRFLPLSAMGHFNDHLPSWFEKYVPYEYYHKAACCSEAVVTFHYITPDMMYLLEFFTYHLAVFGLPSRYSVDTVDSSSEDEILKKIRDSSLSFSPPRV